MGVGGAIRPGSWAVHREVSQRDHVLQASLLQTSVVRSPRLTGTPPFGVMAPGNADVGGGARAATRPLRARGRSRFFGEDFQATSGNATSARTSKPSRKPRAPSAKAAVASAAAMAPAAEAEAPSAAAALRRRPRPLLRRPRARLRRPRPLLQRPTPLLPRPRPLLLRPRPWLSAWWSTRLARSMRRPPSSGPRSQGGVPVVVLRRCLSISSRRSVRGRCGEQLPRTTGRSSTSTAAATSWRQRARGT